MWTKLFQVWSQIIFIYCYQSFTYQDMVCTFNIHQYCTAMLLDRNFYKLHASSFNPFRLCTILYCVFYIYLCHVLDEEHVFKLTPFQYHFRISETYLGFLIQFRLHISVGSVHTDSAPVREKMQDWMHLVLLPPNRRFEPAVNGLTVQLI